MSAVDKERLSSSLSVGYLAVAAFLMILGGAGSKGEPDLTMLTKASSSSGSIG